jgi:hypothetical protein
MGRWLRGLRGWAGVEFRTLFAAELVDVIDRLGVDTTNYMLRNWRGLIRLPLDGQRGQGAQTERPTLIPTEGEAGGGMSRQLAPGSYLRKMSYERRPGGCGRPSLSVRLVCPALPADARLEAPLTPTMEAARRLARTLAQSRGFDAERLLSLLRRLAREPKAQVGQQPSVLPSSLSGALPKLGV